MQYSIQLSFLYCIIRISFPPVSSNMFSISFGVLIRIIFNIRISAKILFVMIYGFCKTIQDFSTMLLSFQSPHWRSLTSTFLPTVWSRQARLFFSMMLPKILPPPTHYPILSHVHVFRHFLSTIQLPYTKTFIVRDWLI